MMENFDYLMKCAQMFESMLRLHPELCPHDWEWQKSVVKKDTGLEEFFYYCPWCGEEKSVIRENN